MILESVVESIKEQEIVDGDVVAVSYRRLTNRGKESRLGFLFGTFEVNKKALGGFTVYPDIKHDLGLGRFKLLRSFSVTFYAEGSSGYTALDIVKLMDYSQLEEFAREMPNKF